MIKFYRPPGKYHEFIPHGHQYIVTTEGDAQMSLARPHLVAAQASASDPWMSIDQLIEQYPFLRGRDPQSRRRIYRLRDLGHFPNHDGKAGRILLWRKSTIEAWLESGNC